MNPRDKAYDLFKKVYEELGLDANAIPQVKRICLLMIDEILQTNLKIKGTSEGMLTQIIQTKEYWHIVQSEINNL